MAESIQIKRAQTEDLVKNTPLKDGEMAYAKDTGNLFIGTNGTIQGNKWINKDGGGGTGTNDHTKLVNRNKPDQHVIESITGLSTVLANKQDRGSYATTDDLKNGLNGKQDKGNYVLKNDIPTELPNPNKLTFTGAVSATYDGSTPVTVNIPNGGGGTGTNDHTKLINRNKPDQHTINAITGLQASLDSKQALGDYALKKEIPTKLPNPYKINFTGNVTKSYDGSSTVDVYIPSGSTEGSLLIVFTNAPEGENNLVCDTRFDDVMNAIDAGREVFARCLVGVDTLFFRLSEKQGTTIAIFSNFPQSFAGTADKAKQILFWGDETAQLIDRALPSGGGSYTLPQATNSVLGGVKVKEKSVDQTEQIGIDKKTGLLYTAPGKQAYVKVYDCEDEASVSYKYRFVAEDLAPNEKDFFLVRFLKGNSVPNIWLTFGGLTYSVKGANQIMSPNYVAVFYASGSETVELLNPENTVSTDVSLGISNASVGQFVVINSVGEGGKPTSYKTLTISDASKEAM